MDFCSTMEEDGKVNLRSGRVEFPGLVLGRTRDSLATLIGPQLARIVASTQLECKLKPDLVSSAISSSSTLEKIEKSILEKGYINKEKTLLTEAVCMVSCRLCGAQVGFLAASILWLPTYFKASVHQKQNMYIYIYMYTYRCVYMYIYMHTCVLRYGGVLELEGPRRHIYIYMIYIYTYTDHAP